MSVFSRSEGAGRYLEVRTLPDGAELRCLGRSLEISTEMLRWLVTTGGPAALWELQRPDPPPPD